MEDFVLNYKKKLTVIRDKRFKVHPLSVNFILLSHTSDPRLYNDK